MTAYATSAEYATFAGGTTPDDLPRLIDRAGEVVDDFTRTAVYEHDSDGLPTGAIEIAAFRDAACAQVEFWLAGDEEDDVLGPLSDLTIGNVKAGFASPLVLAPRAGRILRAAFLYRGDPVTL